MLFPIFILEDGLRKLLVNVIVVDLQISLQLLAKHFVVAVPGSILPSLVNDSSIIIFKCGVFHPATMKEPMKSVKLALCPGLSSACEFLNK